jgi:hypothetical protein
MRCIVRTIRARFNGTHIELEEPLKLKPDAKLLVTVLEDGTDENSVYPLTLLRHIAVDMGVDDLATRHQSYAHPRPSTPDAQQDKADESPDSIS